MKGLKMENKLLQKKESENSLWDTIKKDKEKLHSFLYKRFEKYSWVGEYLEIKQACSINRLCEFIRDCGHKTIDYDTLKLWLKDLQEAKYLSLHIEPTRLKPAFIYSLLTCPSDILEDRILEYQHINKRVTDKKPVKEIWKQQSQDAKDLKEISEMKEKEQSDLEEKESEEKRMEENEKKRREKNDYDNQNRTTPEEFGFKNIPEPKRNKRIVKKDV